MTAVEKGQNTGRAERAGPQRYSDGAEARPPNVGTVP